ncbi:hypothetical protein COCON_G00235420, partial [Conger conger]
MRRVSHAHLSEEQKKSIEKARATTGKMHGLRMVMIGKTGAGKSSAANIILGDNVFFEDDSAEAVTTFSKGQSAEFEGKSIYVVDTPGLFSANMDEKVKDQIKKSIKLSDPGPNVFLLVVRLGRFTQEDKSVMQWFQKHFGEEASRYTMVLFTGADQIKKKTVGEFLNCSEELQELINCCGCRYHVLDREDERNLTQLMLKIEEMMKQSRGKHYTIEMFNETERRIKEEEDRGKREEEEKKRQEEEKIRAEEKRKWKETERNIR